MYSRRRSALESLELDVSPRETWDLLAYATGRLRGRVTGLSPGNQDVEFELELGGVGYKIALAALFDVDVLPSGESTVQLTGILEPMGGPGQGHAGGEP